MILVQYWVVSNDIQLGENNKIHLPLFRFERKTYFIKNVYTELNKKRVAPYEPPNEKPKKQKLIVKPVCNGPVYSGHPVYYGY